MDITKSMVWSRKQTITCRKPHTYKIICALHHPPLWTLHSKYVWGLYFGQWGSTFRLPANSPCYKSLETRRYIGRLENNRSAVRVTIAVKERLDETLVEWREKRVVFVIREADLLASLTFVFRQISPAFLGNLTNLWSILRVFLGQGWTFWGGRWGGEGGWEARSC